MKDVFVHPAALVETVHIGPGTRIWAFTHILKGARIGANCNIGDHCYIEGGVRVGDNVTLKNGNMLWEGLRIEDGAFIGPHVFFTNDRFPRSPRLPAARQRYSSKENWLRPTVIGRGATLGAGAVILPDLTIGDYAVVGAGAVVTRSVPDHTLVVGNPARRRGYACRCGQILRLSRNRATCRQCGLRYEKTRQGFRCRTTASRRPD